MRCPDCNKFVAYNEDDPEPEVENLEIDADGNVTATATLTLTCAECGAELKSGELEFAGTADATVHEHLKTDGAHELAITQDAVERASRTEGHGRWMKTFYGATISYTVTCACNDKYDADGEVEAYIQASAMDELV